MLLYLFLHCYFCDCDRISTNTWSTSLFPLNPNSQAKASILQWVVLAHTFEDFCNISCYNRDDIWIERPAEGDMSLQRLKVLLFLAFFFGAAGFLLTLLSWGTEYWLLAAESCSLTENQHEGIRLEKTNVKVITQHRHNFGVVLVLSASTSNFSSCLKCLKGALKCIQYFTNFALII